MIDAQIDACYVAIAQKHDPVFKLIVDSLGSAPHHTCGPPMHGDDHRKLCVFVSEPRVLVDHPQELHYARRHLLTRIDPPRKTDTGLSCVGIQNFAKFKYSAPTGVARILYYTTKERLSAS